MANTFITLTFMAKALARAHGLDEILVIAWFGHARVWKQDTAIVKSATFNLGPHVWWMRLDVEEAMYVLERIQPDSWTVPARDYEPSLLDLALARA